MRAVQTLTFGVLMLMSTMHVDAKAAESANAYT